MKWCKDTLYEMVQGHICILSNFVNCLDGNLVPIIIPANYHFALAVHVLKSIMSRKELLS